MFGKKIRIRQEKDKTIEKKVYSFDYYKSEDKKSTRFDLFNYFMKDRNTLIHINTNMTASVSPKKDRDNVLRFKESAEKDNIDFYLSPAARENNNGFLGKIVNRENNKLPAYNILLYLPAGTFTKDIFDKYFCTYFFRAGIGFKSEDYQKIKSDFETGLLTSGEFHKIFEYDFFDAFEFNHIKIISDMIDIKDLTNIN